MSSLPFLPYARQYIDTTDVNAAASTLSADIITRGPIVDAFEKEVAAYCGAKYAVAFNTGSTALAAACHAAGVGPGDKLISTPNTFVASVIAGMHKGATPVFVDIDRNTGNIDLKKAGFNLEPKLSRGRYVLMPVHFAGIPVDVKKLSQMLMNQDDIIIEDAAHALGTLYTDGSKIGSCQWSDMTIFSFHPAKTITTGEGGIVTTNNSELAHKLQLFRNNGIERSPEYVKASPLPYDGYYEVTEMTGNYNFTEFQAALGLSQLKKIDKFILKRRELIKHYRELLKEIPNIRLFTNEFDDHTAFHLCVVQIDFAAYKTTRGKVVSALKDQNIGTQVHYIPVYHHPAFTKIHGDISSYFPEMETYYSQALTLPLYYSLRKEDVERVVTSLKKVLSY